MSMDPQERYIYAFIDISGKPSDRCCQYVSHTGNQAIYSYDVREQKLEYYRENNAKKTKRETLFGPPLLRSVASPCLSPKNMNYNSDFCLTSCEEVRHPFVCTYGAISGSGLDHYGADSLWVMPSEGIFEPVNFLSHQKLPEGRVLKVTHDDLSSTTYHYSSTYLPIKVLYHLPDGQLWKETCYEWTDNQWQRAVEVRDTHGTLLYRKDYEYDSFGNPTVTTLTGDLEGVGKMISTVIKRQFSQDGRHLLIREEDDNGKILVYDYLPGTHLPIAKLTQVGEYLLKRCFYEYDDSYNLVCEIEDDGHSCDATNLEGVTQRLIKRMRYRQEAPFIHMLEWVEEYYLENEEEKLLKKLRYSYDQYGHICQEDLYDATQALAHSLYKQHNARGNLLSETNALGQKATNTYDKQGRRSSSTNFSGQLTTHYTYDMQGHLLERKEVSSDASERCITNRYDVQGRIIERIDRFGNSTHYRYGPFNMNPICVTKPAIVSTNEQFLPIVETFSYDVLGRETSHTDANGFVTTTSYNSYDSPAAIIHPNGSREQNRYSSTGQLLSHTDVQGVITRYTYDVFDRITSKTLSTEDNVIGSEIYIYNTFHLISKTDLEGNITAFTYDKAGRLLTESFGERTTQYSYDALGRVVAQIKDNGPNSLCIRFERDLLGRILKRSKHDLNGQIFFQTSKTYDHSGHLQSITRYPQVGPAVDTFRYDAWGRVIVHIDPLGHCTTTIYDETQVNALGQRVLTIIKQDPDGITTQTIHDVHDHVICEKKVSSTGEILSHVDTYYDTRGNLCERHDHLYLNHQLKHSQVVAYNYTSDGRVSRVTRAFGSPDSREVTYTYHPNGQIATKTKADGIVLTYTYDALGHLASLTSSDELIHHTFIHNRLGHLIGAKDEISGLVIERTVNPYGQIIKECCGRLLLEKSYDPLGRAKWLLCPDVMRVDYAYDSCCMRHVSYTRLADGTTAQHCYTSYDQDGNLMEEHLPFNSGIIRRSVDKKGRCQAIESPYFSQSCHYDVQGNLLCSHSDDTQYTFAYDDLSQLREEIGDQHHKTYAHDSNYNCLEADGQENIVNELNELLSDPHASYLYDRNGNVTACITPSTSVAYLYDSLDRLKCVIAPHYRVEMSYDPLGRRTSKTIRDASYQLECEYYLYDNENEMGSFDAQGKSKQLRCFGLARHSKMPQTILLDLNGRLLIPILDYQGNVRRLWDPISKAIVGYYDYSAYGLELSVREEQGIVNPWRYASKRLDAETGLINFGKRYYFPIMGRWLTTDPIGFTEGTNLYTFLLNSPFRYIDPDGQTAFAFPLLFGMTTVAEGILWSVPLLTSLPLATTCLVCMYIAYEYPEARQWVGGWVGNFLVSKINEDEIEEMEERKSKPRPKTGDKHRPDHTPSNTEQDKQFDGAMREVGKGRGKPVSNDEIDKIHDLVTGRGCDYKDLVETAKEYLNVD